MLMEFHVSALQSSSYLQRELVSLIVTTTKVAKKIISTYFMRMVSAVTPFLHKTDTETSQEMQHTLALGKWDIKFRKNKTIHVYELLVHCAKENTIHQVTTMLATA